MNKLTAIVIGATGLVGTELLRQLAADRRYGTILSLGRRAPELDCSKLRVEIIDFEKPDSWQALVQGDVIFSALGTTIKAAGSQSAQHRVDHDYQFFALRAARANGVRTACLVSSAGADPRSLAFYTRMKAELEEAVMGLSFERLVVLRPGILDGERAEHRPGEKVALEVLRRFPPWMLPAKARPVPVPFVASAARTLAMAAPGLHIAEAADIFALNDAADT